MYCTYGVTLDTTVLVGLYMGPAAKTIVRNCNIVRIDSSGHRSVMLLSGYRFSVRIRGLHYVLRKPRF